MTEDKTKEYRVRLRHVHSDIGPFSVPPTMTMGELKRRAFEEWPIGTMKKFKLFRSHPWRRYMSGRGHWVFVRAGGRRVRGCSSDEGLRNDSL
jgi:hypothetical protein